MSKQSRQYFIAKFIRGYAPTQQDYNDWFDSYDHKDDPLYFSGTASGNILNVASLSASTYTSGATSLETVIRNLAVISEDVTRISNGSNIYTGGTANLPIINLVDSPFVNNFSFSGTAVGNILNSAIISASTFTSGATDLATIISTLAVTSEDRTRVQHGTNTYTGGTGNLPTVNISAATLSYLSATTVSADTFYSGSTRLEDLFMSISAVTGASTFIQPGSNITTGGTISEPIINLIASPSVNNFSFSGTAIGQAFSATTISAGTFYSGSTRLEDLFMSISAVTGASTFIQQGSNITTGGTISEPIINLVASPSINNFSFSGTATGNILNSAIISASTYTSGNTSLETIIHTIATSHDTSDITRVQNGSNITTGGTGNLPTINLVDSPFVNNFSFSGTATGNILSAVTLSASTLYIPSLTGTTLRTLHVSSTGQVVEGDLLDNLYITASTIISLLADDNNWNTSVYTGATLTGITDGQRYATSGYTYEMLDSWMYRNYAKKVTIAAGTNTYTGGTETSPTVNLVDSPSVNNFSFSGTATGNILNSATISATTYTSGATSLETIIHTIAAGHDTSDVTRVQPGSNITTGGTGNLPTINLVDSPSVNNFSFSGTATGNILNSATISATTLTATNSTYFDPASVVYLSGSTMTGQLNSPNISATTVTATTFYSGATDLSNVFAPHNYNGVPITLGTALSDEVAAITTGTSKLVMYLPHSIELTNITACLSTSGTPSATTINILQAGTTIFSTNLTIDEGQYTSTNSAVPPVITATTLAANTRLQFDVDTVTSGATGLKVFFVGYRQI